MKYLTLWLTLAAAVLSPAMAQDVVKVAPENCIVQFENERVRVVEVIMQPGDTLPYHTHPEFIQVPLTGGSIEQQHRGGEPVVVELEPGKAAHRAAVTEGHRAKNVGTTTTRVLNIELKDPPVPVTK